MQKYKTIRDNVNVYLNNELVDTLKIGTTVAVEKMVNIGNNKSIALLEDGKEIIAKWNDKECLEKIQIKKRKKGE